MLKRLSVLGLIIFSVINIALAQSGRRVKAAPTPAPTPQSEETAPESGGYSDSAPNSSRSISVSPNLKNDKKSKKEAKQETQSPDTAGKTATNSTTTAAAASDEEVVKVETNLITIPVSVYNRTNGLYIPNLHQPDFKIFEDGKEQDVAYFATSEKPFAVVLLIDVSPSTAYKIEEIQEAASAFVDQLKPEDQVMVIDFDESVRVLTELTTDRQKIYKAIHQTGFGNGTSLYEAVDLTIRKRLSKVEGRKAIVLFTDGVDTTSRRATFEKTVNEAEESDSIIFPVYFNTYFGQGGIGQGGVMTNPTISGMPFPGRGGGASSEDYVHGRAYLESLANVTGGRLFRPESTPGGLTTAFEEVAEELRSQYSIGYYPENVGETGQRKQIRVRVNRPNLVVRARDSYIVGKTDKTQASN